MIMTISTATAVFGTFNCFFFATILFKTQTINPLANRYGGALLISLGLALCYDAVDESHVLLKYDSFFIFSTFCLTSGPFSRFLVQAMLKRPIPPLKKNIKHFIPFLVVWILSISALLFFPDYRVSEWSIKGLRLSYQIHVFIYFVLNLMVIKDYKNQLNHILSDRKSYNLNWLNTICWCMLGVWVTWIQTEYGGKYTDIHVRAPIYCILICFIFYHIIKYKSIFSFLSPSNDKAVTDFLATDENTKVATELLQTDENTETDLKSKPTDPRLAEFKAELLDFMETQKPYLDAELSLPKLAEQMSVSVHFLSQAINTGLNENFYQFVNRYRVEESKKLLHDPDKQHFNILQIAYEAGFNSKTTFNTTFKKMTGISPSEFQKQGKYLEKA